MTTLVDVADILKEARRRSTIAKPSGLDVLLLARTTLARKETLAKGDMSVSVLVRLPEAAGYDLEAVKHGHARTLEDILAEQRQGTHTP